MKKTDFLKLLADRSGVEVTKITEAIASENEEIEIEVPEMNVFTNEELTDKLKNHIELSRKTIVEQAIKEARNDLREKYGVDFQGKSIDNIVSTSIELGKTQANVKPNEKIQELEGVIEKLQKTQNTIEGEWKGKYEALEAKNKEIVNSMFLRSIIPTDIETNLPQEKIAALFNMDIKIGEENGEKVFMDPSGEILRDSKTQNPLTEKEVMDTWIESNGFKRKLPEGRGKGNEHGERTGLVANIQTTEDFYDYCKTNNVPTSDYKNILLEVQKTNPNFLLD